MLANDAAREMYSCPAFSMGGSQNALDDTFVCQFGITSGRRREANDLAKTSTFDDIRRFATWARHQADKDLDDETCGLSPALRTRHVKCYDLLTGKPR
jgi:hypothetical protein